MVVVVVVMVVVVVVVVVLAAVMLLIVVRDEPPRRPHQFPLPRRPAPSRAPFCFIVVDNIYGIYMSARC